MGYLAIARKWRPSRFEDLVGQGHVVQTLKNAIRMGLVSHAYLFSGARGIGKTTVARIFAKALRCPNAKEAVPCNACPECDAIAEGRAVDVVEIDGASNNGVEAVRGIRDNVAYSAASGFYKIYIIDEVHMLSTSAFNALLKTLEEPPKHVIFVFATTEPQKIPQTVLSRCQRFEFRRLTQAQIVGRLQYILDAEKIAMTEAGLAVIASHSDGSLRDALSLLDTVLAYGAGGKALDEKAVVQALGVAETSAVGRFLESILASDLAAIVSIIDENYRAGVDLKHFAECALEELRLLYLIALAREAKDGGISAEKLDLSPGRYVALEKLAAGAAIDRLERMAQILGKAISQLAWASLPRFVLEMAAVRMSKLDALAALLPLLDPRNVAAPAKASAIPAATRPAPSKPPPPPQVLEPAREEFAPPSGSEPPPPAEEGDPQVHSPRGESSWKFFVEAATKKRPMLGALLSHASFRTEGPEDSRVVTVSFAAGSFYERQAHDAKNRKEIDELAKSFFGPGTKLKIAAGGEVAGELNASIEATKQAEADSLRKQALDDPSVNQLKDALGAEIVDVNVEV